MKNRTLRIGLIVAILTLVTSCFMGSTFAKYVTNDSAEDTARVAKWGVVLTIAGVAEDMDLFDAYYDNDTTPTVKAVDSKNVVAPGTTKAATQFTLTGTPEVKVDVVWTCTVTLSNWAVEGSEYCPLIITVDAKDYYIGGKYLDGTTDITSVATLKEAVEEAVTSHSATGVAPNTSLNDDLDISWRWEIEKNTVPSQTNDLDTALGNNAAGLNGGTAATVTIDVACSVTQID